MTKIRVLFEADPASVGVGVGYTLNRVIIDASVTTNQHTGVSFQTSLIFNIK